MSNNNLSWEDVQEMDGQGETFTEADEQKYNSAGEFPVGRFCGDIKKLELKEVKPEKGEPYHGVRIVIETERALEIEKTPVEKLIDPSSVDWLAGKEMSILVGFPRAGEPDWSKNKRLNIAYALGIIGPGQQLKNTDWQKTNGLRVIFKTIRRKDGTVDLPMFSGVFIPERDPDKKHRDMAASLSGAGKVDSGTMDSADI